MRRYRHGAFRSGEIKGQIFFLRWDIGHLKTKRLSACCQLVRSLFQNQRCLEGNLKIFPRIGLVKFSETRLRIPVPGDRSGETEADQTGFIFSQPQRSQRDCRFDIIWIFLNWSPNNSTGFVIRILSAIGIDIKIQNCTIGVADDQDIIFLFTSKVKKNLKIIIILIYRSTLNSEEKKPLATRTKTGFASESKDYKIYQITDFHKYKIS